MKKVKILSVILAVILAFSAFATVTSFAADDGKITLTPTTTIPAGTNYTLHKILILESYSGTNYSYKVQPGWENFFDATKKGTNSAWGSDYMVVNADSYVELISVTSMNTSEKKQTFAQAALKYAQDNSIVPATVGTGSSNPATYDGTNPVVWSGLELGYYVVDSDAGLLCNLTTTDKEVAINGKNKVQIEKKIKVNGGLEESSINQIGDIIDFQISVSVYAGAKDYIVHDDMTAGLTLDTASFVLKNIDTGVALSEGTDYTVETTGICSGATNGAGFNGCDFHIVFTNTYLEQVSKALNYEPETYQTVTIEYKAELNENAMIHDDTGAVKVGNNNRTKLEFDNKHNTSWKEVTVDTFKFDLIKYDGATHKFLSDAEFVLYDNITGTPNEVKVVKVDDTTYRIATPDEYSSAANIKVNGGKVVVLGLDAEKTYYLKEVVAPVGYNLLDDYIHVHIHKYAGAYVNNTYSDTPVAVGEWHEGDGGVAVENNTGIKLPETGGNGTAIFIALGSVVALCAFVVLVARKRSSAYSA